MRFYKGNLLFWRELFKNPLSVGSAFPSSIFLSRAIADFIPKKKPQLILELGSGTGAITKTLLANGISPQELIVLERSPELANYLQQLIPEVNTINADARDMVSALNRGENCVDVIVSSLPLRSLKKEDVKIIGEQMHRVLRPGGLIIQYTYHLLAEPILPTANFYCAQQKYVLFNFPPARIEVLQHGIN